MVYTSPTSTSVFVYAQSACRPGGPHSFLLLLLLEGWLSHAQRPAAAERCGRALRSASCSILWRRLAGNRLSNTNLLTHNTDSVDTISRRRSGYLSLPNSRLPAHHQLATHNPTPPQSPPVQVPLTANSPPHSPSSPPPPQPRRPPWALCIPASP
jgi:hypothetical protein